MNGMEKAIIRKAQEQFSDLEQQLAEAKKDAERWKARLHAYLMHRCHADSTARDEILKCELRKLMDENKPTFDEWVAAIDQTVDQAMREGE